MMRIIYYPYLPVELVVKFIFPVSPVAKAGFKVAISYNHNRNFTEISINKKGCPSSSLGIKYSLEKLIEMSGSHRSVSMLNKWAGVVFSLKYETQQLVLIRHDRKRALGLSTFLSTTGGVFTDSYKPYWFFSNPENFHIHRQVPLRIL